MDGEEMNNEFEQNTFEEEVEKPHTPNHKTDVSTPIKDGGFIVETIGKAAEIVKRHGVLGILKVVLLGTLIALVILLISEVHNGHIIQRLLEVKIESVESAHANGQNARTEMNPKISKLLIKLLNRFDCDRVAILEMHNGKENPTSLPFMYCDMTYEETDDCIPSIESEYVNLNLSLYNFSNYIYEHRLFCGSIGELRKIDKKFASRLEADDIEYVTIVLLRTNVEIGFLMLTFNHPLDEADHLNNHNIIFDYAQQLDVLLDYKQYDKK